MVVFRLEWERCCSGLNVGGQIAVLQAQRAERPPMRGATIWAMSEEVMKCGGMTRSVGGLSRRNEIEKVVVLYGCSIIFLRHLEKN